MAHDGHDQPAHVPRQPQPALQSNLPAHSRNLALSEPHGCPDWLAALQSVRGQGWPGNLQDAEQIRDNRYTDDTGNVGGIFAADVADYLQPCLGLIAQKLRQA